MKLNAITSEAAAVALGWDSTQVLCTINMSEGLTLAALFDALGRADAAAHIIRQTWEGEDAEDRDPLPWEHPATGERRAHDERWWPGTPGDGWVFAPRLTWDSAAGVGL